MKISPVLALPFLLMGTACFPKQTTPEPLEVTPQSLPATTPPRKNTDTLDNTPTGIRMRNDPAFAKQMEVMRELTKGTEKLTPQAKNQVVLLRNSLANIEDGVTESQTILKKHNPSSREKLKSALLEVMAGEGIINEIDSSVLDLLKIKADVSNLAKNSGY